MTADTPSSPRSPSPAAPRLAWRDPGEGGHLYAAADETQLVDELRARAHFASADAADYRRQYAANLGAIGGPAVRTEAAEAFVADLVRHGQLEAVWVGQDGRQTAVPAEAYAAARVSA